MRAAFDPSGGALRVVMCFRDSAPRALRGAAMEAIDVLDGTRRPDGALVPDARGCVRYRFDGAAARAMSRRHGAAGAGVTLLSNRAWLLRDDDETAAREGTIELELPGALRAVVPWRAEGQRRYRLDASHFAWEGYLALTPREPAVIETRLARFEAVSLAAGALDPAPWLIAAADAVYALTEGASLGTVQVILDGRAMPREAPPVFGLSSRGGGRSLLFVVGRDAPRGALVGEWIAVHEMVHLVLPVLRDDDSWLGEGIATYYQEVLRARAGLISPEAAWANLARGFAAGAGAAGTRTLEETARRGGDYARLYWSGAAIALRADVALRRGGTSLDEVIRRWRDRGGDSPRTWSAFSLFAQAGDEVISPIAREALASHGLPGVFETLAVLGVARDGSLSEAPLSATRQAITAPSRGAPRAR